MEMAVRLEFRIGACMKMHEIEIVPRIKNQLGK